MRIRHYTARTKLNEPVEIRLADRNGTVRYVITGAVHANGLLSLVMTSPDGTVNALSNLQSKAMFPRKAVPGWQAELVDYATAGLYQVNEVR